ncbi:MAG: hypothetical protein LBV69_09895 [Bacteroidales bacterium]|jgi:hypothetical protein|nr:hypothetical protein [Bacteroidales bacterium]
MLGLSAFNFINLIVSNFNQIKKGSGNSFLLVIKDKTLAKVAAIEMNFSIKKGFWEIKTATTK